MILEEYIDGVKTDPASREKRVAEILIRMNVLVDSEFSKRESEGLPVILKEDLFRITQNKIDKLIEYGGLPNTVGVTEKIVGTLLTAAFRERLSDKHLEHVSYTTTESTMGKYTLRKADELLIRVLGAGHSNVVMLTGNPGTGKTFFTKCYAEMIKAEYIYTLCHESTNSEDLFYSVNVGKAVLREGSHSNDIYQEGILLKAARLSHKQKVVICIDEIDKTSKRTENLFLDFTENYRVPFIGGLEECNPANITIFFTSNGYRAHSEAFMRRCYRHYMDYLSPAAEKELVGGLYAGAIVDLLILIRRDGASKPSVKEGKMLALNLQYAKTLDDVKGLLYAHICKEPEDMKIVESKKYWEKLV